MMKYLIIIWLMFLFINIAGCRTSGVYGKVSKVITAEGRVIPIKLSAPEIVTPRLNYFSDYDITTIFIEVKKCVSSWFWCWLIFTLLLCGFTELVVYIPKVGWLFKLIGKRFSSLAGACLGWLIIRYLLGGGLVFTSVITILALLSANIGWELVVNWIGVKVKNKFIKKIKPL